MANNIKFNSKIGLIAATVGSAVGLGNIWRFPAEAQGNGGAAFLIIYVICVLGLGVPVMLAEFSIGRAGGSDAMSDFKILSPGKKWSAVGMLGIIASYLITIFYMVVAGWTLEYLLQSVTGGLYAPVEDVAEGAPTFVAKMKDYIQGDWGPVINTILIIGINMAILLCGVKKGIERLSNLLMPLLFVLLTVLCIASLSLPGAVGGLDFFFNPDFSKITPSVIIDALGQAFFSLSLGMGILITYASYFPKDTRLTRTAITVSLLDMLVAVMMGVIIFPAIVSFGMQGESIEGTSLVFVTMPQIFSNMPLTRVWSVLFFLLLMVAALTSTISISEVTVRYFQDRHRMSRRKAVFATLLPLLVLSTLCAMSLGPLSGCTIFGMTFFDLLDTVTTNFFLPVTAMLTCLYIGWFAPKGLLKNELTNSGKIRSRISNAVMFIIRWIAPALIALILFGQL